MYRNESTQKNVRLLCSVTGEEETFFTAHQLDLINCLKMALSPADIASKWECCRGNVYNQINTCAEKVEIIRSSPDSVSNFRRFRHKRSPACPQADKKRIDYQQFADADLSCLSRREREFLRARISYPNLTVYQLADMHGVLHGTFAVTLSNAVKKMNGTYHSRKEYYEKNKEHYRELKKKWWEANREMMLERQREYNRIYYRQNREQLLEKIRSRQAKKAPEENEP